ncbi:2'-5' RNA ligase family protein [Paenibacillus sp. GCM10027626]|uniref:2'-5' RNA ligase family protein n=1 Tax=Paenibacillus sp. GCM10027626 TaxID=3273411 RepID=UPI0036266456
MTGDTPSSRCVKGLFNLYKAAYPDPAALSPESAWCPFESEMMIMYAIELFFDHPFEQYVREIWKGLNEENISSNMYEIVELRPHITLAVYNDISDLETYKERFYSFFGSVSSIEIKFDVLAVFPTTGTLFFGPTVTEDLISMHKQYHKEFSDLLEYEDRYYIPGNWDPHCTLAIKLSAEQAVEAMKYCYKDFRPQRGKIVEAGVVKLGYDSNNRLSSPTVYSVSIVGERGMAN